MRWVIYLLQFRYRFFSLKRRKVKTGVALEWSKRSLNWRDRHTFRSRRAKAIIFCSKKWDFSPIQPVKCLNGWIVVSKRAPINAKFRLAEFEIQFSHQQDKKNKWHLIHHRISLTCSCVATRAGRAIFYSALCKSSIAGVAIWPQPQSISCLAPPTKPTTAASKAHASQILSKTDEKKTKKKKRWK